MYLYIIYLKRAFPKKPNLVKVRVKGTIQHILSHFLLLDCPGGNCDSFEYIGVYSQKGLRVFLDWLND